MGFGLLIVLGVIALLVAESKSTPPGQLPPGPAPGPSPNITPAGVVSHYTVIPNDTFLGEFGQDPDLKAFFDDSTPEHNLSKDAHVILLLTREEGPHNNWIPQPAVVISEDKSGNVGYITVQTITQEPGGPSVGTTFHLSTVNEEGGYFDSSASGPIPQIVQWLQAHAVSGASYA